MSIEVHFILKSTKAEKSSVMLVAYHKLFQGRRFKFYLPPVPVKSWNAERQMVKSDRDYNQMLEHLAVEVSAAFHRQFLQDRAVISSEWMRDQVNKILGKPVERKEVKKKQPSDFYAIWETIINETRNKEKLVVKGTIQGKYNTMKWVRAYAKETGWVPSLQNIDRTFYFSFCDFLTKGGITSTGKHIKEIKALLNECEERDIEVNQDFKKKFFKAEYRFKEDIYLTPAEVEKIASLELSRPLSDCRDTFVMACYCGLRFSDWHMIHPDNVVEVNGKELLGIPTYKTKVPVRIPLHPAIKRIFVKHGNRPPRILSNPKTNEYLKTIAKKADLGTVFINEEITDKWREVCTHTARRTFATNAYLSGMSIRLIMAIVGHKKESTLVTYLKLGREEMAQLAAEAKFFTGNDSVMKVA